MEQQPRLSGDWQRRTMEALDDACVKLGWEQRERVQRSEEQRGKDTLVRSLGMTVELEVRNQLRLEEPRHRSSKQLDLAEDSDRTSSSNRRDIQPSSTDSNTPRVEDLRTAQQTQAQPPVRPSGRSAPHFPFEVPDGESPRVEKVRYTGGGRRYRTQLGVRDPPLRREEQPRVWDKEQYAQGVADLRTAERIQRIVAADALEKSQPQPEQRAFDSEEGGQVEGRSGQKLGDPSAGLSGGTIGVQSGERSQEHQPQALPETDAPPEAEGPSGGAPSTEKVLGSITPPENVEQCCGCRCLIM